MTPTPTKNESLPELPASFGDHCVTDSVRTMRESGYTASQMRDYGRACYEAALTREAPRAGVPDGWKLVPIEPTREMTEAGVMFGNSPNKAAIIYQNMIHSVPNPPLPRDFQSDGMERTGSDPTRPPVAGHGIAPEWKPDCQGKWDYDAALVELSCRYYPGDYRRDGKPSVNASIYFGDAKIMEGELVGETEEDAKARGVEWAKDRINWFARTLAATATPPAPQRLAQGESSTVTDMTPKRAVFFLERFKREEKLLGPHEQRALDLAIAALTTQPPHHDRGDARSAVISGLRECIVNGYFIESISQAADYVLAALTEAKQQGPGEGFVLVPVDPTDAMLTALMHEWDSTGRATMADNYTAMIAAAAKPSGEQS